MAADRFLKNPDLGVQERLSGHTHATLERLRTQEVGWLGPDPTVRHDGPTPPTAGMGTVKINTREASLRQPTGAFTPERGHGGVVGMTVWQRPAPPVAQQRQRHPLAENARARGREGAPGAGAVQPAGPAPGVVKMAERDGESQAWVVDPRRRAPDHRAAWMMRATCHRRLVPGAAQRDVGAERPQTHAWGPRPIALARQPEGPPRPVTRALTAKPVTGQGARRPGGQLPPVPVRAVSAREPSPAQGEEPRAWGRLTSRPVTAFPRACTVVPW